MTLISKSWQNEEMIHEPCSLIPLGVRTVASSSLGFAACLSKNPDFSQSSELPLFTKGLRFYPKLQNNADIQKHFWRINAVHPINKGISRIKDQRDCGCLLV